MDPTSARREWILQGSPLATPGLDGLVSVSTGMAVFRSECRVPFAWVRAARALPLVEWARGADRSQAPAK